ncbi:alpha/beta hydrolase [Aquimarina sp. AD10]|uniref:alpha/beta hydrolase n=1 Tax=Aquimarina sp. AD10 TaxID=1714849 RepID=UPI000E542026|nr:alpha/beta hydrolase [Aquimarina sp. AD10]AXT60060.1 alpha/beta hydrolase [Aquimarina sp. AD10]RKM96202.1 alpha/beta hydrolase [Aquimarina sp. AD10]
MYNILRNIFYVPLSILLFLNSTICSSQDTLPIWQDLIPNYLISDEVETREKGNIFWIRKVQKPSLEIYLPSKQNASGRAIMICPGGGYGGLAYDWEGTDIAKWLNSKGIAAFVLKYRLPKSKSVNVGYKAPLQDAQRAMRIIRSNAEKWNINRDQIGVMGFSAGGHLAATLGTHYRNKEYKKVDVLDTVSAKPNFMVLVYPVISMKENITHQGSKDNLLGDSPKPELVDYFSNELYVDKDTSPTFIVHASDDKAVSVLNSISFYTALIEKKVYTEMHIYPKGGHGFGLAIGKGYLQNWTTRLDEWLTSLK